MSASIRAAVRSLLRGPAFTALAVATLALGIGATTATFTVLHQVILRPLPIRAQDEVVVAWGDHRVRDFPHYPILWEAYTRVRDDSRTLVGVAATDAGGASERLLDDEGGPTPVRVGRTLGDFFGVLGVIALAGRTLSLEDEAPGAPPVVVVSHAFWLRRWGRNPSAIGSTLSMAGQTFQVVGVLPEEFDYPRGAELWTPVMGFNPAWGISETPYVELDLVGRLAPNVTPADVAAELERFFREDPELVGPYGDVAAIVRTLPQEILGDLRPTLFLLFGGALLVLGVALFNVANLIFVRAAGRDVALAVRRALGADPLRLVREALAEGAVLGALAGALGGVLAAAALRWVLPLAPGELPRLQGVGPQRSTFLFVAGLTTALVLLLGLMPVLWSRRVQPAAALRGGRGSVGGHKLLRRSLLMGQAALALWAVAAAMLMVRTLRNLQALDLGFDTEQLMLVQLDHTYGVGQVPDDYPSSLETVVVRLDSQPGILAATPVIAPPLAGSSLDAAFRLEGQSREEALDNPYMNTELVLPGYFRVLNVHVSRGRTFEDDIGPEDPGEVVVNAAAAQALWPGQEAVGKRVNAFGGRGEERWWTVVGVVADMRYRTLIEPRLSVYIPLRQLPLIPPGNLLVRTEAPMDLLPLVASAFAEVDPSVRVVGASSVRRELAAPLARHRLSLAVLGAFGVVVLLLAGIGVYGVMAASVRGRLGEMGVRMACGAAPVDVGGLVVRQGMVFAAVGALVGLGAAMATGRLLEALLFGVTSADPVSLGVAAALVLTVATGACLPAALRAARTDPVRVLREE